MKISAYLGINSLTSGRKSEKPKQLGKEREGGGGQGDTWKKEGESSLVVRVRET